MIDEFRKAEKVRREACDQVLELTLNLLSLYTTLCSSKALRAAPPARHDYESMARERLGRAILTVSRLNLTPRQNERFCRAFRELADCLPIPSPEKVISIDSVKRSA